MVGKVDASKEFRKSLGLVLVFVGMQFNTAIKNVAMGIDLSVVIMLLSALLLLDINSFFRVRMLSRTRILMAVQFLLLMISLVSDKGTTQLITFHLYLLAILFALSTNKEYIRFAYFGKILFWVSGFIAILILFQATNGFTRLNFSFDVTGKLWLSQGGDPITMSRALEFNFIACLFYKEKNKIEKIVTWIFVVADIIGVLSFGNRSVMACSIAVFIIWHIRYFNRKIDAKKLLITVAMLIIIVYAGSKITYFKDKIHVMYISIKNGLGTLLNFNTVSIDPSAKSRVTILNDMKVAFNENFMKNFWVGMGYNYTYVDRPVYQIYFDFGIVGLGVYMYFLILIPLKRIVKQLQGNITYNNAWIFIIYSSIQTLVDQFLTGLPYYYILWTPTIFILFSISNYKLKSNGCE